jgi:two-component system, sporulation sensor kinase E
MKVRKKISKMNIYENRSKFKIGFVVIALLIAGISLIYTNILVNQLASREHKLIDLYVKALEFAVESDLESEQGFLIHEIIGTNNSVPVIWVRENKIQDAANIYIPKKISPERKKRILERELQIMKEQYPPVVYSTDGIKNYVYYRDSDLLYRLRYYPYAQLAVIFIFGFITFIAFDYSKRAEQNRVWAGLAKETAHQLGTPISSLMAWIDYLRLEPSLKDSPIIMDLEKDVKRLEMITARFSSIGSEPTLKSEDIYFIVLGISNYLQRRISTKVNMTIQNDMPRGKVTLLNRHLFEWVIENICKNAVDAMNGVGSLTIHLGELPEGDIFIDITDTGKGMTKQQMKKVFNPGFTTKKRGWGLGLTLAKRIVENYHKGKLFVKYSELDKGTVFRIALKGVV